MAGGRYVLCVGVCVEGCGIGGMESVHLRVPCLSPRRNGCSCSPIIFRVIFTSFLKNYITHFVYNLVILVHRAVKRSSQSNFINIFITK